MQLPQPVINCTYFSEILAFCIKYFLPKHQFKRAALYPVYLLTIAGNPNDITYVLCNIMSYIIAIAH